MSARLRRLHASKIKWMFYWEKTSIKVAGTTDTPITSLWSCRLLSQCIHQVVSYQTKTSAPISKFNDSSFQEPLLIPMIHFETYYHSSYDIFLLQSTSGHFLSCCLLSFICLLDIGKDLLTLRSPWVPRCRGPVLALFFHTHFILSIFPPNTVALQSSPRSQGQILQIHSFTRDPLCSLEAIGQASLLPIFAIFCLLLLSGGGFFWFVCVFFFFSPNTFPDNSCCSQDILENIHCVQIPNCKWILPECCIMVHGWLPNHWLAVMLEAPWHIFMAKVNYC